jgi:ketosteroid isomerase-like protein
MNPILSRLSNSSAYAPIKTADLTRRMRTFTLGAMNTRVSIVVTLVIASLLAACTRDNSPRQFADRFVAAEARAWATGDVGELKSLERDDVIYHLPGLDLKGWKAHEDFILNGRGTVSDLKQNWKYLSGEGKHIVLAYDSSAIARATDKTPAQMTSNDYLFVLRLEDEHVAEVWANGSTTNKPIDLKVN